MIDTTIAKMSLTGLGIGVTLNDLKTIVEFITFNLFIQTIDQVSKSVTKQYYMSAGNINSMIVFHDINDNAAGVTAHHVQCFAAWYPRCIGWKAVAPYPSKFCKRLIKSAICDPNLIFILNHEIMYGIRFPIS